MFEKEYTYQNKLPFRQIELENYYIDHIHPDSDVLFVTFEGSDPKKDVEPWQRYPWGVNFLSANQYAVIGVKHKKVDWYRGKDLHEFFMNEEFIKLVRSYKNVFFYGNSMGGYAALAFSRICPGATVLAYTPQSTLNPEIAPWDTRYPLGSKADWSGAFSDATEQLDSLKKAYIIYDPFWKIDRQHARRFAEAKNIHHLKAPLLEHKVTEHLSKMKILKTVIREAVEGDLAETFPKKIRKRKSYAPYLSRIYFHKAYRQAWAQKFQQAYVNANMALKNDPNNKQTQTMLKRIQDILSAQAGKK